MSTHAVLRTGVLQLTRWGLIDEVVAAGTPPIRSIVLGFGDDRIRFDVRDEFGIDTLYGPRRIVLDEILLRAAVEAGVDFMDATSVKDLLHDPGGRVTGVIAGRAGDVSSHRARVVIGADGVWSRVARLVGAEILRSHPPLNAAHYAYFTGVDAPGFWFQFTPGTNAGVIPTNDGRSCVFVARPRDRLAAFGADPDGEFHRLLSEAGADLAEAVGAGTRAEAFRGTPGLPGFLRRPWGPGWALVGDAGYTKDPISAHGISDALRDAELCARAVDGALRRPDRAADLMDGYQAVRDTLSVPLYEESRALAGYGWTAQEASARMRAISDVVRMECEMLSALPEWPGVPGDLARAG